PPDRIGITGSGMKSDVWTSMLADVLDRPLELTDAASEGRGAAIFCATALGRYPTLEDAIMQMVKVSRIVKPDKERAGAYNERHRKWHFLVDSTRPLDGI
ncbi:MAG: FGGY-family carbohydrate kinase, partial [Pseudomonadales bacterium]